MERKINTIQLVQYKLNVDLEELELDRVVGAEHLSFRQHTRQHAVPPRSRARVSGNARMWRKTSAGGLTNGEEQEHYSDPMTKTKTCQWITVLLQNGTKMEGVGVRCGLLFLAKEGTLGDPFRPLTSPCPSSHIQDEAYLFREKHHARGAHHRQIHGLDTCCRPRVRSDSPCGHPSQAVAGSSVLHWESC